jgi:hypothetical protein
MQLEKEKLSRTLDLIKELLEIEQLDLDKLFNNKSWSLIGGHVNLFVKDSLNVSYSCFLAFNPDQLLAGDNNSRYFTIENKTYYDSIDDYIFESCSKNMNIPNFQSNSSDIKETIYLFHPLH